MAEKVKIEILVICPNCNENIIIEELNCCIFRHGILKENNKQIEPHSSKVLCDFYVQNDKIYGCGKPFQIIKEGDEYKAIICDYI
jgi:hypothetical protein